MQTDKHKHTGTHRYLQISRHRRKDIETTDTVVKNQPQRRQQAYGQTYRYSERYSKGDGQTCDQHRHRLLSTGCLSLGVITPRIRQLQSPYVETLCQTMAHFRPATRIWTPQLFVIHPGGAFWGQLWSKRRLSGVQTRRRTPVETIIILMDHRWLRIVSKHRPLRS